MKDPIGDILRKYTEATEEIVTILKDKHIDAKDSIVILLTTASGLAATYAPSEIKIITMLFAELCGMATEVTKHGDPYEALVKAMIKKAKEDNSD